jgi:predicted GIY-YIG superfamily endonuclease
VIGLHKLVLKERKFAAANPQYNPAKPCVYVGMTGLTPRQRFLNHRLGIKGCKFVRNYGLYLRPGLYEHYNPMTYDEACAMERELARLLRKRGYAVWQK